MAISVAPYFEGCHGDIKETVTRNVSETTTLVCEPKGIPTPDKTWYRVDQRNRNEMRKCNRNVCSSITTFDKCQGNNCHLLKSKKISNN